MKITQQKDALDLLKLEDYPCNHCRFQKDQECAHVIIEQFRNWLFFIHRSVKRVLHQCSLISKIMHHWISSSPRRCEVDFFWSLPRRSNRVHSSALNTIEGLLQRHIHFRGDPCVQIPVEGERIQTCSCPAKKAEYVLDEVINPQGDLDDTLNSLELKEDSLLEPKTISC